MNLTRAQIRAAITALKVSGRIIYNEVRGKSGSHFAPVQPSPILTATPWKMSYAI